MNYERLFSKDTGNFMRSPVRDIFKKVDLSAICSFAGGYPDAATFPLDDIKELCALVLDRYGAKAVQYGATQGVTELREAIAERYGVPLANIQITTSSQQGIDVCTRILADPGDVILTTSPTYLGALQSFKSYRAEIVPLAGFSEESAGVPAETLARAKFCYVIPDFQNPGGTTMSLEERRQLCALSEKYGFVIVEDAPYRELRYSGDPVPTIWSLAPDRTLHLGTFSKIFAPGFRLGWIFGPEELLDGAPDRSVPVVVLLHGNTNDPRTQAETSGFVELASEEKFFVVEMEWQGSRSAGAMGHDGVEAVLYELTDKYPQLDPSRIYCEGLSAGSITSTQLGIVKSHVFAAVGGHSGGLLGSFNRGAYGLRSILAEAAQKRVGVEMPYCGVLGTADDVVPFYNEDNFRDNNYILAWNAYLTMNGLDTIDSIDFDVDPVFGFSLSDRETVTTLKGAGISMETGVIRKGEVPMIRLVAVNDYGHWNFKPTARVMWDFFKHFSRDQKTYELIYTP